MASGFPSLCEETETLPLAKVPLNCEPRVPKLLPRDNLERVSFGVKGTLIFEDPDKEKLMLNILDDLADMVR